MRCFTALDLVWWTYSSQKAHLATTIGTSVFEIEGRPDSGSRKRTSSDGCEAIERYWRSGTRMGRGSYRLDSLHEAAELVHEFISRLPDVAQKMIIGFSANREIPSRPRISVKAVPKWTGKAQFLSDGLPNPAAVEVDRRSFDGPACLLQYLELPESYPHTNETWRSFWETLLEVEQHFLKPKNKLPGIKLISLGDAVPEEIRHQRRL